jgi:hypothetical protein
MLVEEVHDLSYQRNVLRVILRSVTDDDIDPAFRLSPAAARIELYVEGERADQYRKLLGEYVTMKISRRAA